MQDNVDYNNELIDLNEGVDEKPVEPSVEKTVSGIGSFWEGECKLEKSEIIEATKKSRKKDDSTTRYIIIGAMLVCMVVALSTGGMFRYFALGLIVFGVWMMMGDPKEWSDSPG